MRVITGGRDLESARRVVSRAELDALDEAEQLRNEARELLVEARAEAARVIEGARTEAEEAAKAVHRALLIQMAGLRDALGRADESFGLFLQSAMGEGPMGEGSAEAEG